MKIYLVNGVPESGKTYFENYVVNKIEPYGLKISTIDFVKQLASLSGWDGTKTPNNRKFLSDLKDLLTQWGDVPFLKILDGINQYKWKLIRDNYEPDNMVIFIDIREPEELEKFKVLLEAKTILIRRPDKEQAVFSNHADSGVFNYNYDFYLNNNKTLSEFNDVIENFMKGEKILCPKEEV